jgi:mannose-6-phosphate isomerase-like protein (cupin superfamily)
MEIKQRDKAIPFITKDTAEIREILSPRNSSLKNQSLAEARLSPGKITVEHYHIKAEEIYYILKGTGKFIMGDEVKSIKKVDAIVILPGIKHRIENNGTADLFFLCCCAPSYNHDDTVLST